MDKKVLGAGAFKQGCLALLDEVAEKHIEIVITKRGQPVAKLVPIESAAKKEGDVLAKLRDKKARLLVEEEEFLRPTADDAGWSLE